MSYIYMMVDQNSFIRERPLFADKKIFRESFANSMFICRGTQVEQQLLLWRFITCQITQNYHENRIAKFLNYGFYVRFAIPLCGSFFCGATPYGLMGWNRVLQKNNFSNSEKLFSSRMLGLLPIRAKSICLWKTDYRKPRKRHIDKPYRPFRCPQSAPPGVELPTFTTEVQHSDNYATGTLPLRQFAFSLSLFALAAKGWV